MELGEGGGRGEGTGAAGDDGRDCGGLRDLLGEKQTKYGEIGVIEDGLDHELEEVTYIPGTGVPEDGTSSVGSQPGGTEPGLEVDLGLEAEDQHAALIPGTAVPDDAVERQEQEMEQEKKDVVFLPGQREPEIGLRIPEIESRWESARPATAEPPAGAAGHGRAGHKISWGEEPPRVARQHTWHGPSGPQVPVYSWDMWPGPCPTIPRYLGSLDLPEAPETAIPGLELEAAHLQEAAGLKAEEKALAANGDLGSRRGPGSAASSSLGHPDLADFSDLKRQPSRSSLVSTMSRGVRDRLGGLLLSLGVTKSSDQTKLRVLVCILFAVCFSLVAATHVFYRRHQGEVRIFDLVRLEEHHRDLMLFDVNNRLVAQGHLGRLMEDSLHPYPCLPDSSRPAAVKCLEWKGLARLEISPEPAPSSPPATSSPGTAARGAEQVSCHRIVWRSLTRSVTPRDCWPIGPGEGHWYGGGERLLTTWPLGDSATVRLTPFVTGDEAKTEWGNVIKKFWLNSRGLTITVDDDSPLSVSINDPELVTHGKHGLCLQASFDEFPYYYHRFNLPVLNYSVCTAPDLQQVYAAHLDTSFWEDHTDSDIQELDTLLQLPVWQVPSIGQNETYTPDRIERYLHSLLGSRRGRGDRGYILLDYHWQENMGDFTFSPQHFPTLRQAQDKVREAGLRLALTINPFVSVDSPSFREGVMKGLFVKERNSTSPRGTPALTWFKDVPVAALLDITNTDTVAWLRGKLRALAGGDASEAVFFLDTGNTFHTPHYFSFNRSLSNPDLYKQHFVREAMEEVRVIGVSGASSKRPKAPAFVWLSPLPSSWASLQSIVPNILHLGVIGYPFVNPGPIGGLPETAGDLPAAELYWRWWQLATFLPQLHFLTPPSAYSPGIAAVAGRLKDIRERVVTPLLQILSRDAMRDGRPLVRPLWMLAPADEVSQRVSDQFMLGDSLLVAPVLRLGQRARDVYLPPCRGVWRSSDGRFFNGGRWLNQTEVGLDEVIYFERQETGPTWVRGPGP